MSFVSVQKLQKSYAGSPVFENIDCRIERGEFVTLLGPSGCGKSTLLRCIAGLTPVDSGQILLDGHDIVPLSPQKRGIGMVFQSYALFPNMTVEQNVAFGLRMQKVPAAESAQRVREVLEMVELGPLTARYPHQLSGGQCQRVALARSLVTRPRLLLLDEPLSALDARIRKHLREQIRRIQQELKLTTVFVTHDQEEAMEVADRIVVMNKGVIEQIGSPGEVYEHPANDFVYHFLGDSNRLALSEGHHVLFRPHEVSLSRHETEGHHAAEVRDIRPLGATTRVTLKVEGQSELIEAEVVKDHDSLTGLARGETLFFRPKVWQKVADI